tara:strand:+ start:295 stop:468 length:174 start_codon:yes stop_codon:yes gene_type:complete
MFISPITVYSVDQIYAMVKANNRAAITAAQEAQYQRQLFRKWCLKLGEKPQSKLVVS